MNLHVPIPDPDELLRAWTPRNDAALRLGLAWIEQRLAGATGEEARAAWLDARRAMVADGVPSALDRVSARFVLAPFDEDVLLIALAAAIDGAIAARYGIAQGRGQPCAASPHLVALVLFGQASLPFEAMRRLGRTSPLRRHVLIELDERGEVPVTAAIALPERVRETLCGHDAPDAALRSHLRPLTRVPLPERLEVIAARVAAAGPERLRLQIVGPPRSGRRALAAAIMDRLDLDPLAVAATAALQPLLPVVARDAILDDCGIVLLGEGDGSTAAAAELSALLDGPLVVVAEAPAPDLVGVSVLRLTTLDPTERAALWRDHRVSVSPEEVADAAEQFALGPSEIAALAARPGLAGDQLWAACRDLGARDLDDLALRLTPQRSWSDLVLPDATTAELRALAAQMRGRATVYGAWGMRRLLGSATGVSALFAGASGVGKTLAAEVLAAELGLDLCLVDLSRITSKYIGETEKNLRRIFDAAEAAGIVLFFDEADAIFGKRSEVKDSHDRYANAQISYLLQRMERHGGLSILATNLKGHLDGAFLRRLRVAIDFPPPDVEARLRLWRRALPETVPAGRIDWHGLARLDLSGGNIVTIAANAAFRAAADGRPLDMGHLGEAAAAEFRKLDRDLTGMRLAP